MLISSASFEGIESFDWFQELPNISDYDIIILDIPRIFTFWSLAGRLEHLGGNEYSLPEIDETAEKIKSNLLLVKRKLVEILEFDRGVYALYSPDIRIGSKIDRSLFTSEVITTQPPFEGWSRSKWYLSEFISTNLWCPISIKTVVEGGRKILTKDNSYEEYFKDFKGCQYYFISDSLKFGELEKYYSRNWKVDIKQNPIATNNVGKPIALELIPLFHKWLPEWEYDMPAWESSPKKIGGPLVLLPVDNLYNTRSLIEVLLRRIEVFEKRAPTIWANNIKFPEEEAIEERIATDRQTLAEFQKYKSALLCETGLPLQEFVKSALNKLGATVEPSPVSDEFTIRINGKEALIEVKAVDNKSISKRHLQQLTQDMVKYRIKTGQNIKGILVGNPWRLHPVEQRGAPEKPMFTDYVVSTAPQQDIGLISTTELLRAFYRVLVEPGYKGEVLNKIITGKGVITF